MFGFAFKRIGSSSYSVYEHEKEVLFITPYVLIIKIEEVKINNPVTHARIFNKFQNQCLTLIYALVACWIKGHKNKNTLNLGIQWDTTYN